MQRADVELSQDPEATVCGTRIVGPAPGVATGSIHITREIYTHVTPPMQSDAAERVAALIRDA